jgi:hypothetical protein
MDQHGTVVPSTLLSCGEFGQRLYRNAIQNLKRLKRLKMGSSFSEWGKAALGLGLSLIFNDIKRYNQRKYNEWKSRKKQEQRHRKNSRNYSHSYPSIQQVQPASQSARLNSNYANPTPRYPTLKGELVRSLSEKYVADFFFTHRVAYEYEKNIFLDGKEMKPDFYLPTYDLYVEFWGMLERSSYFDSFKWKVEMYNKHRINFIALNLEDLPDLTKRFEIKLQYAIKNRR